MFRTTLTVFALLLSTTVAGFAACSGHSDQAMTCAEGSEYDAESGSCKVISS